jgi:protoporphyrinogen oxidase
MVQLSLIPALEAARFEPQNENQRDATQHAPSKHLSPMAPANRPTPAQVAYLKKLTRIKTDAQLARFVMRQLGLENLEQTMGALTRHHFAQVIDKEVSHKRWAA